MQGPLRIIFSIAILAMWIVFGIWLSRGDWSPLQWAMLAAAHGACLVIFYNFAYVFTYGYAISALAVHLVILGSHPSPAALLVAGLCILYGLRLWSFVHGRNRDAGYREIRARGDQIHGRTPFAAKLALWIMMGWLMAFQGMAAYFAALHGTVSAAIAIGAALMLLGLLLEAAADRHKQRVKAGDPGGFAHTGLYARTRHPNYLGEIVFQCGLIIVAIGSAPNALALLGATVAPLYIAILMYYAAREADQKQQQRYAQRSEYLAWRDRTGMLLPG